MLLNTKLVTCVALVQRSPRCTGPWFLQFCFSPQGGLCQISAWQQTQQDKHEFGKKWCIYRWQRVKEMDRERETDGGGGGVELRKRKKEGEGEKWGRKGFNDAENWPVSAVYPLSKSLLQLPVNLSVLLSSPHRTPPSFLSLSSPSLILWGGIQNFHLLTIFGVSP